MKLMNLLIITLISFTTKSLIINRGNIVVGKVVILFYWKQVLKTCVHHPFPDVTSELCIV